MKRTANIRHARFRKRHRLLTCTAVLSVPFLLTGCDRNTPEPFSTIAQCQQQYNYTAAHCRQIYGQAIDEAKLSGKRYATRQDCINDNREDLRAQQQCQYTTHGSGAHFFYVPRYYSYSPGSYAQPFYRSRGSNSFTSSTGKPFTARSGGFTRTTTITRGGFGHTASVHASHSSGG